MTAVFFIGAAPFGRAELYTVPDTDALPRAAPALQNVRGGPVDLTFSRFAPPVLTKGRIWSAYAVAVSADALQFVLGPFGWSFADEIIDLLAAAATWLLLGFHPLLLPTFIAEFLPVVDMLPTWTACVAIVVGLRKRQHPAVRPPSTGPIIDV
jgi:hypothetical protein